VLPVTSKRAERLISISGPGRPCIREPGARFSIRFLLLSLGEKEPADAVIVGVVIRARAARAPLLAVLFWRPSRGR
jgi:hypothetical protein